jgi:hypothetical protein
VSCGGSFHSRHGFGVVKGIRRLGFALHARSQILAQDDRLKNNILAKRNHGEDISFYSDGE